MARKNTQLSISDKWSLEEQLGAALRELDNKSCTRQDASFKKEVFALMQQFNISAATVLEWSRENILNDHSLVQKK